MLFPVLLTWLRLSSAALLLQWSRAQANRYFSFQANWSLPRETRTEHKKTLNAVGRTYDFGLQPAARYEHNFGSSTARPGALHHRSQRRFGSSRLEAAAIKWKDYSRRRWQHCGPARRACTGSRS